jgi:death on curing protein
MSQPPLRYPSVLDVIAMHQEIMAHYSQVPAFRDKGEALLESALMRPQMAAYYEEADLAKQAALLIIGIAQVHPFVDGNKRIAFATGIVFLQLNGCLVNSRPGEFGKRIVALLEYDQSEGDNLETFAAWIRSNLQPA